MKNVMKKVTHKMVIPGEVAIKNTCNETKEIEDKLVEMMDSVSEAGIMKEYRERMLNSPRSRKVLDAIFDAALDHDHKGQTAAWKLILDRIVPVSGFEKMAGASGRAAIQVNISGVKILT